MLPAAGHEPTTSNAGPRDAAGEPGPDEAALMDDHVLHGREQPLEILRAIHGFDPGLACAVHVVDPSGTRRITVENR